MAKYTNSTFLFLSLFCFLNRPFESFAQQTPVFTQASYESSLFNPARRGEGFMGVQYRQQWLGLDKRYAPSTLQVTLDFSPWVGLSGKRLGIGLVLNADQAHILKRTQFQLDMAYRIINENDMVLSAGLSGGLLSQRLVFGDSRIANPGDLAIYSGEKSQSVINGGLGIYFRTGKANESGFRAGIVVPQLFTSDLNAFKDSISFTNNRHLLAHAGYRFQFDGLGIEPTLLYHDMIGDRNQKTGKFDISLRGYFADNRFWAGLGMRLDASMFNLTLGGTFGNVKAMAGYDTHKLGGSFEAGVYYAPIEPTKTAATKPTKDEGTKPPTKPKKEPVIPQPSNKNLAQEEFNKFYNQMNMALITSKSAEAEARNNVNFLKLVMPEITKPKPTEASFKKVDDYLAKATQSVEKFNTVSKVVYENASSAEQVYQKGVAEKQRLKDAKKKLPEVTNIRTQINTSRTSISTEFTKLKSEIDKIPRPKNLTELLLKGDVAGIKTAFQKEVDDLSTKPQGLAPVDVVKSSDGKTIQVVFSYPNAVESKYDINEMGEVRSLVSFIATQAKVQISKGVAVESILLRGSVRSPDDLKSEVEARYKNEYGTAPLSIEYQLLERGTTRNVPVRITSGTLRLEHLMALKLRGIQKYMKEIGDISSKISLVIATGESGQKSAQVYSIAIVFKQ